MNVHPLALTVIFLLGIHCLEAQTNTQPSPPDPLLEADGKSQRHDSNNTTAVSAALAPAGQGPVALPDDTNQQPDPEVPNKEPVTTAAPNANESTAQADTTPVTDPPAEATAKPSPGLAVRVEKLQIGIGLIDPAQVKLLAPFPAKPLTPAPTGWHLEPSEKAPPITRDVELSPGNKISLTIRPHLLVPDADGNRVFSVLEPSYDPALGYRQSATVGAILAHSINQLEDDAKELGTTIDKLQQLLVSMPKSAPATTPSPESKPAAKPVSPRLHNKPDAVAEPKTKAKPARTP